MLAVLGARRSGARLRAAARGSGRSVALRCARRPHGDHAGDGAECILRWRLPIVEAATEGAGRRHRRDRSARTRDRKVFPKLSGCGPEKPVSVAQRPGL